jgi:diaminohydroxyphosphoribosylaminopyrimidine deaminase / 5-amino-6-(5-phosphoribosylamino)uracil reductase
LFQGIFYLKGLDEMSTDRIYMKRALELAKKGTGFVDPNPLVGAVIVKDNKIIGEGYHMKYGGPHAEVNAINHASESVKGATMYVTLEPCAHYGKTPPCASLLIKHELARVVIASLDPNPLVAGRGIQMLKDAHIEVEVGVLDDENKQMNKAFFKFIQSKKPYVIMKTAMTADGKIATVKNESKWISNEHSRQYVHHMRHQMMAIMVGINTIKHDDPMLTSRLSNQNVKQPIRIILDTKLEIDEQTKVIKTAKEIPTILFTTEQNQKDKINQLTNKGVQVFHTKTAYDEVDLNDVMTILGQLNISSVLLEGGSNVNFSALRDGIVDEVYCFIAPKIFGGKFAMTPVGGKGVEHVSDAFSLNLTDVIKFDQDVCLIYDVIKEK